MCWFTIGAVSTDGDDADIPKAKEGCGVCVEWAKALTLSHLKHRDMIYSGSAPLSKRVQRKEQPLHPRNEFLPCGLSAWEMQGSGLRLRACRV